jgi:aryl-alcohol dehydrogenase-like predicted oxidoreductase
VTSLPTTTLGRTGVEVSRLGYGAMELRRATAAGAQAADIAALLNGVLDHGINLIDTSPDYGGSEELIGEHLGGRRDEFFLASKCGCLVGAAGERRPGQTGVLPHDFTPENIRSGVEQSLRRMNTDHLDLVQFHISPSRETLEQNGAVEALQALRNEGKTRFIGMSGTLPNLVDHIEMGVFDAFQIPYSALERDHEEAITDAADAGAGTIIRGGVARGAPEKPVSAMDGFPERMVQAYEERRERWADADLDDLLDGMTRMEFMLRFTLSHPQMHTTIVGTRRTPTTSRATWLQQPRDRSRPTSTPRPRNDSRPSGSARRASADYPSCGVSPSTCMS